MGVVGHNTGRVMVPMLTKHLIAHFILAELFILTQCNYHISCTTGSFGIPCTATMWNNCTSTILLDESNNSFIVWVRVESFSLSCCTVIPHSCSAKSQPCMKYDNYTE